MKRIEPAPAYGLTLLKVNYNEMGWIEDNYSIREQASEPEVHPQAQGYGRSTGRTRSHE